MVVARQHRVSSVVLVSEQEQKDKEEEMQLKKKDEVKEAS